MSRVGLVVAATAALGFALAGCSAMPDWAPDWLSSKPDGPQLVSLQFDSQPPGAEVRTTQGQTCLTPCSLSISAESQPVTINKIGFVPQTVQLTAGEPPDHSFWESAPPPTMVPNPVQVVLQAVPPPPRRFHRAPPRHVASKPRHVEPKTAARQTEPGRAFPQQQPMQQPAASPFPPPPTTQPAGSPFPPPPSTQ